MTLDAIRKPTQSAKARRSHRTRGKRATHRAITSQATRSLTASEGADDLTLVQSAERGDRSAFDVLVKRHQPKVLKVMTRYMRDATEAKDITQAAFVKALGALHRFNGKSALYTWLHRIATNTAKNTLAAMKLRPMDYLGTEQYDLSTRLAELRQCSRGPRSSSDQYQGWLLHVYGEGIDHKRYRDERAVSLRRGAELRGGTKYGLIESLPARKPREMP
jgi:RNA polymerase sigma factor (sigma-70 family)